MHQQNKVPWPLPTPEVVSRAERRLIAIHALLYAQVHDFEPNSENAPNFPNRVRTIPIDTLSSPQVHECPSA